MSAAILQWLLCSMFTFQAVITPRDCTRGEVIGSVVVVVVDTNFGVSQQQGTCATCKRHVGVATGGKLAPAPSN